MTKLGREGPRAKVKHFRAAGLKSNGGAGNVCLLRFPNCYGPVPSVYLPFPPAGGKVVILLVSWGAQNLPLWLIDI